MLYDATGYLALIQKYNLQVIPNHHYSYVYKENQTHKKSLHNSITQEIFPAKYNPKSDDISQLEFALKYDGINLAILYNLFLVIDKNELISYIKSKPTGKYARILWFLYEFLIDELLPLDDLTQGNYIDLLDTKQYYTLQKPIYIKRQRVKNNLLGTKEFCPIVRKTKILEQMLSEDLAKISQDLLVDYPAIVLKRVLSYLYTKETKSSFSIEHQNPNQTKIQRFISLLQEAQKEDFCTKNRLIELQNRIVDNRFANNDYRTNQNYVAQSISLEREKIYYISPKPQDIEELMRGLIETHNKMMQDNIHPIIHAAIISYGFVYLHPFEDGNGRIHRFLIHNILAIKNYTPKNMIFPVSAVMLNEMIRYDDSLEEFSSSLIPLVEYELDQYGYMKVKNDTKQWYQYIDMTTQCESLYYFVKKTIDSQLPNELQFITSYDSAKNQIANIVDMPDRLIDLAIKFILQNGGKLSKNKKEHYFDMLHSDEIKEIENAVNFAFDKS
jgi:hypothetical protein